MSSVSFLDGDGNPVNDDDIPRSLEDHRKAVALERVREMLAGVVCPDHLLPPEITLKGNDVSVKGCCEKLEALVKEKAGSA